MNDSRSRVGEATNGSNNATSWSDKATRELDEATTVFGEATRALPLIPAVFTTGTRLVPPGWSVLKTPRTPHIMAPGHFLTGIPPVKKLCVRRS